MAAGQSSAKDNANKKSPEISSGLFLFFMQARALLFGTVRQVPEYQGV